MGIPGEHRICFVSGDIFDLCRIQSQLEKATGGFMSEIMEVKPGDPRFLIGFGEILGDRVQADIPELPVDSSGTQTFLKDCHGNGRQGNDSLQAVFVSKCVTVCFCRSTISQDIPERRGKAKGQFPERGGFSPTNDL